MARQPQLDKSTNYSLGAPHLLIGDPTTADGEDMMDFGQIPEATLTVTPNVYSASDVGGHQQADATYGKGVDINIDVTLYDFQEPAVATFLEGASNPTAEYEITAVDEANDQIELDDADDELTALLEAGDVVLLPDGLTNGGVQYVEGEVTHSSGTTTVPVEADLSSGTVSGEMATIFYDAATFETSTRKLDLLTACLIPRANIRDERPVIDTPCWWIPAVVNNSEIAFPYIEGDGEDSNESYNPTLMSHLRRFDQAGQLLPSNLRKGFKASPSVVGGGLGWSLPSTLRDA